MTKHKPLPSQERLQELFDYSVVTGRLYRKVSTSPRVRVGQQAGFTSNSSGYMSVRVDSEQYLVHRIIWWHLTGQDPGELEVDHKDLNRVNNSWHNLRLATTSQNRANCLRRRTTKSLHKGAYAVTGSSLYQSSIRYQGKSIYLGTFPTPEEAHAAYCKAAAELHEDFARTH